MCETNQGEGHIKMWQQSPESFVEFSCHPLQGLIEWKNATADFSDIGQRFRNFQKKNDAVFLQVNPIQTNRVIPIFVEGFSDTTDKLNSIIPRRYNYVLKYSIALKVAATLGTFISYDSYKILTWASVREYKICTWSYNVWSSILNSQR